MLLHARERHVKLLGKGGDRSVCTPELLQNAASGGVRERAERDIEVGLVIVNHVVHYITLKDSMATEINSGWISGHKPGDHQNEDNQDR